ncbi:MAG: hypothetical protein KAG97_00610 [Victivallales bacterium]|nr:hypothetical protein [Victivallales bacterium]
MGNAIKIKADFPGGNIVVDSIDGDIVNLRSDLRDTEGNWFYWSFAVTGAASRTVTFHFGEYNVLTTNGPAVSGDGGNSWRWLGAESTDGNSFTYEFPANAVEVRFCLAFPYLEENLNSFLQEYEGNKHLSVETLCVSEQGREVELLRLGCLNSEPLSKVLITCRHHCCEMMANLVLEGIMRSVLDAKSESTRHLRDNFEFIFIPFVDKDGVENGDQGKNRRPHDHNRDYDENSIYASVKAIRELATRLPNGELSIVLDLHCPHVKGDGNENAYLVGSKNKAVWRSQKKFSRILEKSVTDIGSLPFSSSNNLPFGTGWNSESNFSNGKPFIDWVAEEFPEIKLAASFEIPYAKAGGTDVTPASASAFGANLAESILRLTSQ